MWLLTDLVGAVVEDRSGKPRGKLDDLSVRLAESYPLVVRMRVRGDGGERDVRWEQVASLDDSRIRLRDGWGSTSSPSQAADEIWLARHVLDTQVVDVGGRRLVRVGDVILDDGGNVLRAAAIEIGQAAVLRRLGLRRLAGHLHSELVDWSSLHLTSSHAHAIQLRTSAGRLHRLSRRELEELLARLPAEQAAAVSSVVQPPDGRRPKRRSRRPRYHRVLSFRRRAPS